ncbi:MAG: hypothetical protein OWR52_12545, partial [Acidibacillus sp.]|nr:hypothetical protein [Acidibacillus sp.]
EYDAALYVNGTYVHSSDVYVTWSAAPASCPTPPSLTASTPAAGATTDAISVYDPSNDALELSVNNGGTLSQSFVYGTTTVDVSGQTGTTYKEERLGSSYIKLIAIFHNQDCFRFE